MSTPPASPQATVRAMAIRLLAQREHSRAELTQKLSGRIKHLAARQAEAGIEAGTEAADAGQAEATAQGKRPLRQGQAALPSQADITHVLDQLEQKGLLSDQRAAQAYVRSRAARFGTARLSHDLRRRGIDEDLISASLAQDEIEDEASRAARVWHGKFKQAPQDAREWARQARFLQGRGFAAEVIRKLLKHIETTGAPPQYGDTQE